MARAKAKAKAKANANAKATATATATAKALALAQALGLGLSPRVSRPRPRPGSAKLDRLKLSSGRCVTCGCQMAARWRAARPPAGARASVTSQPLEARG